MVFGHSGTYSRGTQPRGIERHFLEGNRPLWYMLPTVVLSPHDNARYFLDGNRPLWYILLRYSATTVMYTVVYFTVFYIFLGYSRVRVFGGRCEPPAYFFILTKKNERKRGKKQERRKKREKKHLAEVDPETLFTRNSKLIYCPTKTCIVKYQTFNNERL